MQLQHMRRVNKYETEYSRFDSPIVTFRDKTGIHAVEISAGGLWNVDIDVFREQEFTYVLSWNERHPYVGLERFFGHDAKGKVSLGKKEAIEGVLGKRGLDLTPITMAKRLAKYLECQQKEGAR